MYDVCLTTFTGEKFDPVNPDPSLININDIAHGLALTCRYTGQCKVFYSVAEHSVRLARQKPAAEKLGALMHDAAEAYLTDIPHRVKPVLLGYRAMEINLLETVFSKYGINWQYHEPDEYALLAAEVRVLVSDYSEWHLPRSPIPKTPIKPWTWQRAEQEFLRAFDKYGGEA